MSLNISIRHQLKDFSLTADFASKGPCTALFGPSGSGKTTIANIIAGLLRPQFARITLNNQLLADTANDFWLPPYKRRIAYVFQDARLLPHFTVQQNLTYGQWFTPQNQRFTKQADIIEILALSQLLQRKPGQLSGGEKQRVALGRALLQSPKFLLLDEPLASLDMERKQEILPYIVRLRDEFKIPMIYVSHAISEVTRLATDVVVLKQGRVLQAGPLVETLPLLQTSEEALSREAGSLLEACIEFYDPANDLSLLSSNAGPLRLVGKLGEPQTSIRLHLRATDITLATQKPEHLSALNILEGRIEALLPNGPSGTAVHIICGQHRITSLITSYSAKTLQLHKGCKVYAIIKAMSVHAHSAL